MLDELEKDDIYDGECKNDGGFCIMCEQCVYFDYNGEEYLKYINELECEKIDGDILILTDKDLGA
jgi:hypothetical protein